MAGNEPFASLLPALATQLAAGEVTAVEVMEACLQRLAAVEAQLHCFAWLDEARARRLAGEADAARAAGAPLGPLHGVPVGIKDIIDVAGIPAEHGSALFAGRIPVETAPIMVNLEAAGAIALGKTVTTEMAFFSPGATRNPWNTAHTPGGSSSGSAAAVAAGIVPGSVGTQTNGSVIRPAAFCGVVGFKPTQGTYPRAGMLTFAESLDQPGVFARSVEGAAWLAAALAGQPIEAWWKEGAWAERGRPFRLAAVRTRDWPHAQPAAQAHFEACVAALEGAGVVIDWPELPGGLDDAVPTHRTIMTAEGAASLYDLTQTQPEKVSAILHAFLAEGAAVPSATYHEALREQHRLKAAYAPWAAQYDAILSLPAAGEAPTPETTGDPRFCTRWQLVGAPAVTIPTGLGPHGLPLGLQLAGAPGEDARVLATAAWAATVLPAPPGPPL